MFKVIFSILLFLKICLLHAANYEFTYKVEIFKPSHLKNMRVWVPFPTENHEQKVTLKKIKSEFPYQLMSEEKYGNRMLFLKVPKNISFPLQFQATFQVERHVGKPTPLSKLTENNYWNPRKYLGMDKNVPIHGIIEKLANEQTQMIKDPNKKIRKMYEYVVDTMTYSKEGKGWGEGNAIWACSAKRGNCTDFHSLFIGMARSQNIPARFEIGFPIPQSGQGLITGYHCWARVYSQTQGWMPLDASEAKKEGKKFEYFGNIPDNRIHFTTGRDLVLNPPQKSKPLNYFIYPYIEVNGKPYLNYKKEFYVKSL